MAPHPGIDTDQIKDKARKDLLDLIHGVCKAFSTSPRIRLPDSELRRSVERRTW